MRLVDTVQIADFETTPEGFMVSRARMARTGIQEYPANLPMFGDAPKGAIRGSMVRLYRPSDEVFADASIASYSGRPLTVEHEESWVTPDNADRVVVGFVSDARPEGEHVAGNVYVTHRRGIDAVKAGKVELSVGYSCEIDWTPGTITVAGQTQDFDAVQRGIAVNHVTLTSRGRCGESCRLHDSACQACESCGPKSKGDGMKLVVVDCDGISVEMTEQAAQAFEKIKRAHAEDSARRDAEAKTLTDKVAELETAVAKAEARADAAKADADEARKLADAAKPEALDALVADRAKLIEDAHLIAPALDCAGKDAGTIRREALVAAGVNLDGKSDVFVDARFEAAVEVAREKGAGAPGRAAAADLNKARGAANDAQDARSKYLAETANAYAAGR